MSLHRELLEGYSYCRDSGFFYDIKRDREAGYISKGYRVFTFKGLKKPSHVWAYFYINKEFPNTVVDHINRDKLDNSWENLRLANKSENALNCSKYKNNKSGYKGVHYCNTTGKWKAQVKLNGKRRSLGYYDNAKSAAEAYNKAASKSDYAVLNKV